MKKRIISVILALVLIAVPVITWTRTTVVLAENIQTLTIDDVLIYEQLLECLKPSNADNKDALISNDDNTHTIVLDMEKVGDITIEKADMLTGNSKTILEQLFAGCTNLKSLKISKSNLGSIDFSLLNNRGSLVDLYLVECGLNSVPDLTLNNLYALCLSKNDLSAAGACDNITKDKFPAVERLWLDDCGISDAGFVKNMGNLTNLSLGDNKLTDSVLDMLLGADNLKGLRALNLGGLVHLSPSINNDTNSSSSNKITDTARLASLPAAFTGLGNLFLSGLEITSLQDFAGVRDDIIISFRANNITDFAGFENNNRITLECQEISLTGNYAAGRESEVPELIKRILDTNDALNGNVQYVNCSLSGDGTKIAVEPNKYSAYIDVTSGKLKNSKIAFTLKSVPSYEIPKNLTANVGGTLADVVLPAGFSWEDSTLGVGEAGVKYFKADYTPQDTQQYIIEYGIDIPVTVKDESATKPTEPETKPTEPVTKPSESTEPETKPTEPETKPTEPATKPADPTEPATRPADPTEAATHPADANEQEEDSQDREEAETKPVTNPTATGGQKETSSTKNNNTNSEAADAEADSSVQTSDASPVVPISVLSLVSGMILIFTLSKKKKSM